MKICAVSVWQVVPVLLILRRVLSESCPQNASIYFHVQQNVVAPGLLLEKFETKLLTECVDRCRQLSTCTGTNFLLNTSEQPVCLLVDGTRKGNEAETPIPAAVMFAASKFCVEGNTQSRSSLCDDRVWTFEKFPRFDLLDDKFVIAKHDAVSSVDSCLSQCVRVPNCEAVVFSGNRATCKLLSISLQSVHSISRYFRESETSDLFERNCLKRNMELSKCTFLRLNHTGFTDVFDARLDAVSDSQTCERICGAWQPGTCRSYTYNQKEQQCFISHLAPRMFGRKPMDHLNADLSFGELDDCMQFSLNCQSESMKLTGRSMKMFSGAFKAKKGREVVCQTNVTGAYDFETEMKYGECGIEKHEKPHLRFIGSVLVKEGSTDMITVKDKMIQVTCKMHDETEPLATQFLSYQLEVGDNSSRSSGGAAIPTTTTTSTLHPLPARGVRRQKYRLEVLSDDGEVANIVNIGGRGHLLITVDEDSKLSENDFVVSELSATDGITKKRLSLIDSNGCVANNSIVTGLSKPTKRQLRIDVRFSGFADQAQVIYHAITKPCKTNCVKLCNLPYYRDNNGLPEARRRRGAVALSASAGRAFDLAEDVYPVRSRREIVMVNEDMRQSLARLSKAIEAKSTDFSDVVKLLETMKLPEQQKRSQRLEKDSTLFRCLTEDFSCALTLLLAAVQVALLFSCVCAVYFYVRQWLRRLPSRHDLLVNNADYHLAGSQSDLSEATSTK